MTDHQKRLRVSSRDDSAGDTRHFADAEGTRWHAYEQAFSEYDRRRGLSLIFASDAAVRRVRDYPESWRTLSDAELLALSWSV